MTSPSTLLEAFDATVAEHGPLTFIADLDGGPPLTFAAAAARVRDLAAGLAELGVEAGQTVALLLANRAEFHLLDLAVLRLGAIPVSLYATSSPPQIAFVLDDARATVVVTEPALLAGARAALGARTLVVVGDDAPDGARTLADVEAAGAARPGRLGHEASPDDLATLIYTSGTTGPPKGVMLTHRNVVAGAHVFAQVAAGRFRPGTTVVSYLPMAHIAERNVSHYFAVVFAFAVTPVADLRRLGEALLAVRPNWFFGVPRTWERLRSAVEAKLATHPDGEAIHAALAMSIEAVRARQAGRDVSPEKAAALVAADARVFAPLRAAIGLDQIEIAIVGAAPSARPMLEWWHALGLEVAEVWGMSETTAAGTSNRPGRMRLGTVGTPSPGCEVRVADDGELQLRGDVLFAGYLNQPERTAESMTEDGWLRTGDVAAIDADGYISIVDRRKELIIGSGGKNISPSNLEALLKSSPLIGQAVVVGDGRPYLSALIVLDPDAAALVPPSQIPAAVGAAVEEVNAAVSGAERIRRWTVLDGDWAPGGPELTPTMKLKRKPIAERYAAEIDAMYPPAAPAVRPT